MRDDNYNIIAWDDGEAVVKTFSSASKDGSPISIKIELSCSSEWRASYLLERLREIKKRQEKLRKTPPSGNK